jgi:hypothetical protein
MIAKNFKNSSPPRKPIFAWDGPLETIDSIFQKSSSTCVIVNAFSKGAP